MCLYADIKLTDKLKEKWKKQKKAHITLWKIAEIETSKNGSKIFVSPFQRSMIGPLTIDNRRAPSFKNGDQVTSGCLHLFLNYKDAKKELDDNQVILKCKVRRDSVIVAGKTTANTYGPVTVGVRFYEVPGLVVKTTYNGKK